MAPYTAPQVQPSVSFALATAMDQQRSDETPGDVTAVVPAARYDAKGHRSKALSRLATLHVDDGSVVNDVDEMMLRLVTRLWNASLKGAAASGGSRAAIDALLLRIVELGGRGTVVLGTAQLRAAIRTELAGRAAERADADADAPSDPAPSRCTSRPSRAAPSPCAPTRTARSTR